MIKYWTGAVTERYGTCLVIHELGHTMSWAGGSRFVRGRDIVIVDAPYDEVHDIELRNTMSHDFHYHKSPYYRKDYGDGEVRAEQPHTDD